MWADGVFSPFIDRAMFIGAVVLCLSVAVWQAFRLGPPRFKGAIVLFWILAAVTVPLPALFGGGIGLWVGGIAGVVITPAVATWAILSILALVLTKPR